MAKNKPPVIDDGLTRYLVALGMIVASLLAIGLLSSMTVVYAADHAAAGQEILNKLLPLLGTWIGTVLAYYFSKENLAAATASVSTLASQLTPDEKLRSIPVKDKMLPPSRMVQLPPALRKDDAKLQEIGAFLRERGVQRLPVLSATGAAELIIHASEIGSFIAGKAFDDANVKDLTWKMLLDDKTLGPKFRRIVVVPEGATLTDVKAKMAAATSCEDVFVTATGKVDEPVLGWITDNDIIDAAKL
jgi:hypothetical protein